MKKYHILILICLFTTEIFSSTARIMLLGDSITYDDAVRDHPELGGSTPRPTSLRHGYRNYLWYKLREEKLDINIDFVGSRSAGSKIIPNFDIDNEGYPGYTSQHIASFIYQKLQQSQPDIILLHIGSNDWSDNISGIRKILDEIDRYEQNYSHHIKVLLARIINRTEYQAWTNRLNHNIQNLANERIVNGDDIVIVDMEHNAGIYYDSRDFQDRAHPNNSGYYKMANLWFSTLVPILKNLNNYSYLVPIYHIILN